MTIEDLDRRIVKSEHATFSIPSLEFEIPPRTQRGVCSTVEGIISTAVTSLEYGQPIRRATDESLAIKLDAVIEKLKKISSGTDLPVKIMLADPSGNSYIESTSGPISDENLTIVDYDRTREEAQSMGFFAAQTSDIPSIVEMGGVWDLTKSVEANVDCNEDVLEFEVDCGNCGGKGKQRMCELDVPGFRKCILMAFCCDVCGAKSNEVKPSGSFGDKCRIWDLEATDPKDLDRFVLKSDSATVRIPSIDFEMCSGTQGGVFTTIEGLLSQTAESLEKSFPFTGDSSEQTDQTLRWKALIESLRRFASDPTALPFTLTIEDPADQSFIGGRAMTEPAKDTNLTQRTVERTKEQNDDLGITDMKVDDY